jgi:hypothetical protein
LPQAEDNAATVYQRQDTCVVIRRQLQWISVEVCQGAQRTSSWTRGLISSEEQKKN